jgi:hypothetical protein
MTDIGGQMIEAEWRALNEMTKEAGNTIEKVTEAIKRESSNRNAEHTGAGLRDRANAQFEKMEQPGGGTVDATDAATATQFQQANQDKPWSSPYPDGTDDTINPDHSDNTNRDKTDTDQKSSLTPPDAESANRNNQGGRQHDG